MMQRKIVGRRHIGLPYWQQQVLRGLAAVAFFAVIGGLYVLWHTHQPGRSGGPSAPVADYRWAGAADSMHNDLQQAIDRSRAGNAQGLADVRTKMAQVCREAGGYTTGTGAAESAVRAACDSLGFPVGP